MLSFVSRECGRPSSIYRYFRMGNHRLKCVKHPFYSHFRAAQGAFPSVQWLNQPNRIYPHPMLPFFFQTGLEYPHFLTPEMSRMPDFIGRDEFLEVK